MALIDDLKLMLDLTDSELDDKLNLIIKQSEKKVLARLPNIQDVPDDLAYIVLELSIVRFNRIGNEGMTNYSQEGETITYSADISDYEGDIQSWLLKQADNKKGVVRFL
ncbi:hypothetical protein RyT2_14960 [Pseudolactococcus yaeyamensis]